MGPDRHLVHCCHCQHRSGHARPVVHPVPGGVSVPAVGKATIRALQVTAGSTVQDRNCKSFCVASRGGRANRDRTGHFGRIGNLPSLQKRAHPARRNRRQRPREHLPPLSPLLPSVTPPCRSRAPSSPSGPPRASFAAASSRHTRDPLDGTGAPSTTLPRAPAEQRPWPPISPSR